MTQPVGPQFYSSPTFTAPAQDAFAITPGTPFTPPCRALYIGTAGNVELTTPSGQVVIFVGASGILPVACIAISSASATSATDIVGLI
jgi:hypothetical protein